MARTKHGTLADLATVNLSPDWHSFDEYCEVADLIKDSLAREV